MTRRVTKCRGLSLTVAARRRFCSPFGSGQCSDTCGPAPSRDRADRLPGRVASHRGRGAAAIVRAIMFTRSRSRQPTALPAAPGPLPTWRATILFAFVLSMLFLLYCLSGVVRSFLMQLAGHKVLQSIGADGFPLVLMRQLALFVLALIVIHAAVGAVAVLLAAATELARPALAVSRRAITFLWFVALVMWVLGANALWYPQSQYSNYYSGVASLPIGPWSLFEVYTVALFGAALVLAAIAALRSGATGRRRAAIALCVALAVAAAPAALSRLNLEAAVPATPRKPNVILLGIDSLRLEQLRQFGGSGQTPRLDEFLAGAVVFGDTITPEARTFPSWVSILTGRHPAASGALFNLMPRTRVDASKSIGHQLRAAGYRTVFAIDEVRFANFDASLWVRSGHHTADRRTRFSHRSHGGPAAGEHRQQRSRRPLAAARCLGQSRHAGDVSRLDFRATPGTGGRFRSAVAARRASHVAALAVLLGRHRAAAAQSEGRGRQDAAVPGGPARCRPPVRSDPGSARKARRARRRPGGRALRSR